MHGGIRRLGPFGGIGLLLGVCAVLALVVPIALNAHTTSGKTVPLTGRPQHVDLPAHTTYGIYVTDANNSGYSMDCSASDADGHTIRMNDPKWTVSSSGTETLDLAYDTGSGHLTITCSVPGESVATRPVPDDLGIAVGALVAVVLGGAAAGAFAIGIARGPRRRSAVTAGPGGAEDPPARATASRQ